MIDTPKRDFSLAPGSYLLSHSVGRPLNSAPAALEQAFFAPWQNSGREPWGQWLGVIDRFSAALAQLFQGAAKDFCPQANLSSAVTKLVMSLDRLQRPGAVVLMSEVDFPSMGFVMQKALGTDCELRFIPQHLDLTDAAVWQAYIGADVDLVFVSHAYSNSGVQAPLADLIPLIRARGALSLVDVAQSAGIMPLDLSQLQPDFMVGSSVKWLCAGRARPICGCILSASMTVSPWMSVGSVMKIPLNLIFTIFVTTPAQCVSGAAPRRSLPMHWRRTPLIILPISDQRC